ncbi:MAG: hypothetical protein ACOYYF_15375 [Chloroflexota bacterium]|nr:hypothetical protein [Chloroflexota bacterium]MBI5705255.1 hypothetical protein [Chloroflexota bacterium]
MTDKASYQDNIESNPTRESLPSSIQSRSRNEKNPYLTAYVGFIVLFVISGIAAWLIFNIPLFLYSFFVRSLGRSPFTELFIFILQIVFGYYAFKHVVRKHILPSNYK